jgi:protein-S-isoprenylcysteine O-methyltransferase Ste14
MGMDDPKTPVKGRPSVEKMAQSWPAKVIGALILPTAIFLLASGDLVGFLTDQVGLAFLILLGISRLREAFMLRARYTEGGHRDKGSGRLLLIPFGAVVWSVYDYAHNIKPLPLFNAMTISGMVLLALGEVFRIVALRTLGRHFTSKVRIVEGHRVVKEGLYRYIRHPGYVGTILSQLSLPLILGSWSGTVIMVLALLPFLIIRIRIEERTLLEAFGEEYRQYMLSTGRFLPRIRGRKRT